MHDLTTTSAREVRAVFNTYVLPRVQNGELHELTLPATPASAAAGQPPGTLSQQVRYLDENGVVARAHRFVLPDGELGASGLPDPKAVLFQGRWLVVESEAAVPD